MSTVAEQLKKYVEVFFALKYEACISVFPVNASNVQTLYTSNDNARDFTSSMVNFFDNQTATKPTGASTPSGTIGVISAASGGSRFSAGLEAILGQTDAGPLEDLVDALKVRTYMQCYLPPPYIPALVPDLSADAVSRLAY